MLSKELIGAARMPPRCSESVTRHSSTKFASLDLIPDAQRARIAKKMVRAEGEELPAQVPYLLILHQQEGIASEASTCNGLVIEGSEFPRISRYAIHSRCRIEMGNSKQLGMKEELLIPTGGIKTGQM
jgi:hypothetical protein